jgi:hypothetical protein
VRIKANLLMKFFFIKISERGESGRRVSHSTQLITQDFLFEELGGARRLGGIHGRPSAPWLRKTTHTRAQRASAARLHGRLLGLFLSRISVCLCHKAATRTAKAKRGGWVEERGRTGGPTVDALHAVRDVFVRYDRI